MRRYLADKLEGFAGKLRGPQREGAGTPASHDQETEPTQTALELLYGLLARLLEEPDSAEPFVLLLREVENRTGAAASAIFAITESTVAEEPFACANSADRERLAELLRRHAGKLDASGQTTLREPLAPERHDLQLVLVSRYGPDRNGAVVMLENPAGKGLTPREAALLDTLVQGIANALSSTRRAQMKRRRDRYDERAAISRELHDSLAQSLSYLKIQASRLQSVLGDVSAPGQTDRADEQSIVQELRANLNVAYRQLRELMTTFRLTMNGRNLGLALEESVEEFEKRSGIVFDLDNRLASDQLPVSAEMQVLHIIREALSNVVRHSHAKHARILLDHSTDETIMLTVEDDGIGIDTTHRQNQHDGLLIMQERAHSLGGDIRVQDRPGGGVRLEVTFAKRNDSPTPAGWP